MKKLAGANFLLRLLRQNVRGPISAAAQSAAAGAVPWSATAVDVTRQFLLPGKLRACVSGKESLFSAR